MPLSSGAVELHGDFPQTIHADERYVIFSHGRIAEGNNVRPVHPEHGVYEFPKIQQALFEGGGFNLIAHQRPQNTDVREYANQLESWVRRLLAAGVKPERITLIGFSKGAQITAHTSGQLKDVGLNTALIGVCENGDFPAAPPLGGRLLSIYEMTDEVGSCAQLAERSKLVSFQEVAISTGKKHGAFFTPRPEWIAPLKNWVNRTNR